MNSSSYRIVTGWSPLVGCGTYIHSTNCLADRPGKAPASCTCAHCDQCGTLYAPFSPSGLCGVCVAAEINAANDEMLDDLLANIPTAEDANAILSYDAVLRDYRVGTPFSAFTAENMNAMPGDADDHRFGDCIVANAKLGYFLFNFSAYGGPQGGWSLEPR